MAWALSSLAAVMAQAQRWKEARATADAIVDARRRADVLCSLAQALAQSGLLPQATALLADLWHHTQARDGLLGLFVGPAELLRAYPALGQAFLDSFAWVDAQLAVG